MSSNQPTWPVCQQERLSMRPEFFSTGASYFKMKLAMKELAETRCWLRILGASGYIDAKRLEPLIAESLELTRMMGASVSTARSRMG